MLRITKPLSTLAFCALFTAFSAKAGDLRVQLSGIEKNDGVVRVALFSDEHAFESNQPTRQAKTPARVEGVWVAFENVVPGQYGISAFQDVNNNEKLDTSFIGLPKEPYGFSQNARGKFGPPGFNEIAVEIGSEPETVKINLR